MTDVLFAYGTLRHPTVMTRVLGREPVREEGVLEGFARFRIRGRDFPGIFPREGERIDGTLFRGLTATEWRRLDEYESELYERRTVAAKREDGSELIAFAYVLPPQHESVCTDEPWDLNQYQPNPDPE